VTGDRVSSASDAGPETSESAPEIRDILRTIEELNHRLFSRAIGQLEPLQKPEQLVNELGMALHAIEGAARAAFERYSSGPVIKFARGIPLTPEEYHYLCASGLDWGAKDAGLSPLTDFEVFSMFFYEDDKRHTLINPDALARWPRGPAEVGVEVVHDRVFARLGTPPEELSLSALRPEQKDFFQDYLPKIYARFKQD